MAQLKFGVSQALTRKEDDALLRGAGRYVSDYTPTGTLHAVVLRSPHAFAKFKITDTKAASAMPGVRLGHDRAGHRRSRPYAADVRAAGRRSRRAAL